MVSLLFDCCIVAIAPVHPTCYRYAYAVFSVSSRNFLRVSSGPEIGAYHHELFRKDKPFLAATMFCKNARTMLAMATSAPNRSEPVESTQQVPAYENPDLSNTTNGPQLANEDPIRNRIDLLLEQNRLASLGAGTSGLGRLIPGPGGESTPSVRLLERQILLLQQQEETNRLLLEHTMLMQQQRDLLLDEEQRKLAADESLLALRRGFPYGAPRKPSGNRASAA